MTHMWMTASGWNPPIPQAKDEDSTAATTTKHNNSGQRLLSLVRSIEGNRDGDSAPYYERHMEELVDLLNHLIASFSRRGLLQGDTQKAERILAVPNGSTGSNTGARDNHNNKRSKKQKQKKGSVDKDLQIDHGEGNLDGDSADASVQQQETLLFTALLRIFSSTNTSNDDAWDQDHALVAALASELLIAMSQYLQTTQATKNNSNHPCTLAEYELLANSGKPLLTGLISKLQWIEADLRRRQRTIVVTDDQPSKKSLAKDCLTLTSGLDEDLHVTPILSCLKAASSLIRLFGTKLSRSGLLLSDLQTTAWRFLTLPNDSIQHGAARLVACLPLAGSIDRTTPSDLWNAATADIVFMLSTVLETMAPLGGNKTTSTDDRSENSKRVLQNWISFVKQDLSNNEESARIVSFRIFLTGLTSCLQSLLSLDGMGPNSNVMLLDAKLNIESILDLVESFVSFPLSAETMYYKTKKRLRNEAVDGGLLSSRVISTQLANHMKRLGHGILDMLLGSIGGPAVLPWARRIIRISYASLLTSCSGPVRKVLDPTSAAQLDGKKRRWLHLSIPLRTVAIRTFQTATLSFGSDRTVKQGSVGDRSLSTCDGELAASLVAACLLEQIGQHDISNDLDDCWGDFRERVELVSACAECLKATLISCGGYLAISVRSLVDSIVLKGLLEMGKAPLSELVSWSPVKVSLLELASSCVTTPWNDGASTCIVGTLIQTAQKYEADMDGKVSTAAKNALRLCAAIGVPRAPALFYVSRAVAGHVDAAPPPRNASASELINKMQTARTEAVEAKKAMQKAEEAKKEKSEEKRRRVEDKEKAKAAKRAKAEPKKEVTTSDVPMADDLSKGKEEANASSLSTTEKVAGKQNAAKVEAVEQVEVPETESSKPNPECGGEKRKSPETFEINIPKIEDGREQDEAKSSSVVDKKPTEPVDDASDDEMGAAFPEIFDGGPDSDDE